MLMLGIFKLHHEKCLAIWGKAIMQAVYAVASLSIGHRLRSKHRMK